MDQVDTVHRGGITAAPEGMARIGMEEEQRLKNRPPGGQEDMGVCFHPKSGGNTSNRLLGLGRTNSNDTMSTDAGRNELFGNASQRYQERQQQSGVPGQAPQSGAYGEEAPGGYGAYGDRQLTAEGAEVHILRADLSILTLY